MDTLPITEKKSFKARALLLGERLDLRAFGDPGRLAISPLAVSIRGGGIAVLFRYGTVVLFDASPSEEVAFLDQIHSLISQPYPEKETEEVEVRIVPDAHEGIEGNTLLLQECTVERLQIVADVLSKSIVLAMYESKVGRDFERIEPLALNLETRSRTGRDARELLKHIGGALLSEHKMVGRVQMNDKPDLIWDRPGLERFYLRLEDEYEIVERYSALERKLELISRTAQTVLELLQDRSNLRVEWYIVVLIVLEILISLFKIIWLQPLDRVRLRSLG
jgi:required for meiotic nuclear division protein 1